MSQKTSQAVTGAAQGAATGSAFGPWGAAIGAGVGLVGGLISGGSADAQFENQQAWEQYNIDSQYNTDVYNLSTAFGIQMINGMSRIASAEIGANTAEDIAAYNAGLIAVSADYNLSLLEQDLLRTWEEEELALEQVTAFRERERGNIVAEQAASGTIIGEGSNEVVVVAQLTQEALDKLIISHGADRQAADIQNEMAKGVWEAGVAIDQTLWEGQVQAFNQRAHARVGVASDLLGATIAYDAGLYSAGQAQYTGGLNLTVANERYDAKASQDLVAGLFQAGSTYVAGRYQRKIPGTTTQAPSGSTSTSSLRISPPAQRASRLSTPGTSLATS